MTLSLPYPSEEEIKQRVIVALCRLYLNDRDLLEIDANERTITHKLAEYLQDEFPEWHVDCEYNRRGDQVKRLDIIGNWCVRPDDTEAKTVFPDVIIHQRRTNANLVVIEVKKSSGHGDTRDIEKLQSFVRDPAYMYGFGLFIRLGPRIDDMNLKVLSRDQEPASWTEDLRQALGELGNGD